jgi:UbiA prenyltransferase family
MISFAINALIILSTIHAQDFHDEVGDKLMGRRTIPIVWPEGSRIGSLVMLVGWSIGLSWACGLAFHLSVPFCAWAVFIGLRFFRKRTAEDDQLLRPSTRRSRCWISVSRAFDTGKRYTAVVPPVVPCKGRTTASGVVIRVQGKSGNRPEDQRVHK